MRCKKCGYISFDWLDTCKRCGKSLISERQLLGVFYEEEKEINWFDLEELTKEIQKPAPAATTETATSTVEVQQEEEFHDPDVKEVVESLQKQENIVPVDLSEIDVSDLTDQEPSDESIDIKEDDLAKIAMDKDFQKVMEEIAE